MNRTICVDTEGPLIFLLPYATLAEEILKNEEGPHTRLDLTVGGQRIEVDYRPSFEAKPNPRATEILVALGGPHVAFTGMVLFNGLTGEQAEKVLEVAA